ncbi:MAG TPA: hypothetical protein DEP46_19345 [Blastocatellia bacterium]|nr:hypothetical protein [Blastocatellia bacterium]
MVGFMKNLLKSGVLVALLSLLVVFVYAQTTTEKAENFNIEEQVEENISTVEAVPSETPKINKEATAKPVVEKKEEPAKAEEPEQEGEKLVKKTASSRARGASKGRFVATAYCLRGRTASGAMVRNGIIAADPRVLRLGTKVYIDGGGRSGEYLVADTGGKIKGNKIDIWMASCAEARRFGRRTVSLSLAQ